MIATIKTTGLVLVLLTLSLIAYVFYLNAQFTSVSLNIVDQSESVRVYPGDHLLALGNRLDQAGLWNHPRIFTWLARWHGFSNELRFGEYNLSSNTTPMALLNQIKHAQHQKKYQLRIQDGWTFNGLLQHLEANDNVRHTLTSTELQKLATEFKLNSKDTNTFEGQVYPDTYDFAWGATDAQILKYAYKKMQSMLSKAWQARDKHLPIKTPYQALIIASLIEMETPKVSERPKIAAVIYNRLRKHMRLQVDPTVMYGLNLPYGSELTRLELKKKTRYNTYRMKGLPPTPIGLPTWTAIHAAVHPSHLKALYYVADGKGGHIFSRSYHAQKRAARRYRETLNGKTWQFQKDALETIIEEVI